MYFLFSKLISYVPFVFVKHRSIAFVFETHPKVAQFACLSMWHAFDANLLGFVILLVGSEKYFKKICT